MFYGEGFKFGVWNPESMILEFKVYMTEGLRFII
jgi:hypothetical protein